MPSASTSPGASSSTISRSSTLAMPCRYPSCDPASGSICSSVMVMTSFTSSTIRPAEPAADSTMTILQASSATGAAATSSWSFRSHTGMIRPRRLMTPRIEAWGLGMLRGSEKRMISCTCVMGRPYSSPPSAKTTSCIAAPPSARRARHAHTPVIALTRWQLSRRRGQRRHGRRLAAAGRGEYRHALLLEQEVHRRSDLLVILHEEQRRGPRRRCVPRLARRRRDRLAGAVERQVHLEGRAATRLRVDPDRSAALLHDAVHGREPEAGAHTRLLRREERLEDPLPRGVVHACAGVG